MKISNYKGNSIGKNEFIPVTKEELDNELANLLKSKSAFVKKEGKSELGDITNIDYEGFLDGVPFEGGKASGYDLELGSHSFIPGFEEGLVGYSENDDVDVHVTFPKEYHAENLKGKPVVFKCHINEVKKKVTPELNDEFAKGYGISTINELKNELERQMNAKKKNDEDNKYLGLLIEKIISESEIEPNDEAVKNRIDEMMNYYEENISQYGMDLNTYLSMTNQTIESFRDQLANEAVSSCKADCLFNEIANIEKLEVTEDEVLSELALYKNYYQMDDEAYNNFINEKKEDVRYDLIKRKTANFLLDNNN